MIVAVDSKFGIGKNNTLPWHLPKEFAHFTRTTSKVSQDGKKNAVIMGRLTWNSIPAKFRPLPNRLNFVLSRSLSEAPEGAILCGTLGDALEKLATAPYAEEVEKVFVIGGTTVYKEAIALPECHRLYVTKLDKDFECDTFFPQVDDAVFHESSDPDVDSSEREEKGIKYKIFVYDRNE